MAQSLCINIYGSNRHIICNCLYPWSGFSVESSEILNKIIKLFGDKNLEENKLFNCIDILRNVGGEIDVTEQNNYIKIFGDYDFCCNAVGIICYTSSNIYAANNAADKTIDINIANNSILFSVFDYRGIFNENDKVCGCTFDEVTKSKQNPERFMSFDDFKHFSKLLSETKDCFRYENKLYIII